ncbi:MAG TPA: BON domain-containing protein [Dehalococcoidia bacterium]|nr:BON domain-containing protein [Dehalococcoidia bacterium]
MPERVLMFGTPAAFGDGAEGWLHGFEMSDDSWTLDSLIVAAGVLRTRAWRVPRSDVTFGDGRIVAAKAQGDYPRVAPDGHDAPAGVHWADRHTRIALAEATGMWGRYATLVGFAVAENGAITHLIGNTARIGRDLVRVSTARATWQQPSWVWVNIAETPPEPFVPDDELRDAILEAARAVGLGPGDLTHVEILVENGTVTLLGNVRAPRIAELLEAAAKSCRGVRSVEARVVADSDLELAVGAALAADERTRGERVQVKIEHGHVRVSWLAPQGPGAAHVEEVIRLVPGVQSVEAGQRDVAAELGVPTE